MQKLKLEKPHKTNTTYSRETAKRALENVVQRIKEVNENKEFIREIKCEGITSQVAIINNYERVGIRFSFYATLYKN